jgi:hypothetical protein
MLIGILQVSFLAKSLLLGIMAACSPQPKGPNIIFIMSDDHAWQAVSAYNERLRYVAPTPNIDRIARMVCCLSAVL